MKELTMTEVQTVSGAGVVADAFADVGKSIGSAMEVVFGAKDVVKSTTSLGQNIGLMLEAITGIVDSATALFWK